MGAVVRSLAVIFSRYRKKVELPRYFSMTQSNELTNRVDRLESDNIDIKLAVSSLIETVNLHQRNLETMQRNFETVQRNFDQRMDTMQRNFDVVVEEIRELRVETRGLQVENRRLMERILGQSDEGTA